MKMSVSRARSSFTKRKYKKGHEKQKKVKNNGKNLKI